MNPGTINTILNSAPMIIQGASKLIKLIRERDKKPADDSLPDNIEGLKQEIEKIDLRLTVSDESSVAQIKLIEELARQNETLAESLKKTMQWLIIVGIVAVTAGLLAIMSLIFTLN